MPSMKLINYRGGIARFYLPSSWVEEYEPEGGATFFENKPDSGTLRINVIGAEKLPSEARIEPVDELIKEISGTNSVQRLPSGAALGNSVNTGMEDGKELLFYTWYIGVPIAQTDIRIIIFTYTVLAVQKSDPLIQQEIKTLSRSILEGEYPAVKGISGDYFHD